MDYCYKHFTWLGVHPHKPLNKFHVTFYFSALTLVFVLALFKYYKIQDLQIVESFSSILIVSIKYVTLVWWRKSMKKVEDTMKKFWIINVNDAQIAFLTRYLKLVENFYRYLLFCSLLIYTLKPLIMKGSSMFNCYIPTIIPIPLFYIFECYIIIISLSSVVSFNVYACLLIVSVAVQFRLLNLRIKEIGSLEIDSNCDVNRMVQDLKTLVEYQQLLLRYVKHLNKLLSVPVLLMMTTSISMLCMNMYGLSTNQGTPIDKSRIIIISISMIFEYFMVYGLPAQLLMDESAVTADMIYSECKWYLPNLRPLQKVFLVMILRSQKSVCIRAGNYHVISNQTVLLMLKTAYSFYTFLQKITKPIE